MIGSSLIGHNQAVQLLQRALTTHCISPAYLFFGPSGIGRTLAAKSFCAALTSQEVKPEQLQLNNHPDVLTVSPTYLYQGQLLTAQEAQASGVKRKAPPQIRVEQIREITRFLSRPPLKASLSVVILEDAQTMTEAASNALLKTLEEPGQATVILIAPSTDSLLPTLVSRCQKIPFYRLSVQEMERVLGQNGHHPILAHRELLDLAQGSPGDAIAAYQFLQSIPETLRNSLLHLPAQPLKLLELAKIVAQELEVETQLWLVDYLQYHYWHTYQNKEALTRLEKTKGCLISYVQSRLVWEWTLLSLARVSG